MIHRYLTDKRKEGKARKKCLLVLIDISIATYKALMREAGDRSGWQKRLS